MYMIGQVAALRDEVTTRRRSARARSPAAAASCSRACPRPSGRTTPSRRRPRTSRSSGSAASCPARPMCRRSGRTSSARSTRSARSPPERWDWRLMFDPDPSARDKVYSRWGGFIDPVALDPMALGLPPKSLDSIEPFQLLALLCAQAALARRRLRDAAVRSRAHVGDPRGRGRRRRQVGRLHGPLGDPVAARRRAPRASGAAVRPPARVDRGQLRRPADERGVAGASPTGSTSAAPTTPSTRPARPRSARSASARASCRWARATWCSRAASTRSRTRSRTCASPRRTRCRPPGRCRPFDATADGIAISEGFATVVLKRLADAERDGDRIYAVIRGVGAASDGRDRSLTAPRPEGQMRALRRAYAQARFSPATVELVEAHGTGTVAGDGAEVKALSTVFAEHSDEPPVVRDRLGQVDDRPHQGDGGRGGHDQGGAGAAPPRAAADDRRERAEPEGRLPREPVLRQQRGAAVAERRRDSIRAAPASAPSASAAPTSTSCSRSTPAATSSSPRRPSRAGPASCCCGADREPR